jgi:hypothetical protein
VLLLQHRVDVYELLLLLLVPLVRLLLPLVRLLVPLIPSPLRRVLMLSNSRLCEVDCLVGPVVASRQSRKTDLAAHAT